jgi:ribosomal protein L37E
MGSFNLKRHYNDTSLECKQCGHESRFKKAQQGCPSCGFHLLKVSHRGNIPKMNPFYQWDQGDPYLRQKDRASGNNSGSGSNLTRPSDEESSGGLGSRFRGKDAPSGFSQDSDEYDQQQSDDVPSSHDDLLSNPPKKDYLDGWFFDPQDPLSTRGLMDEKRKGHEHTVENRLRVERNKGGDKGVRPRIDDNVFNRIKSKQKGVKR